MIRTLNNFNIQNKRHINTQNMIKTFKRFLYVLFLTF